MNARRNRTTRSAEAWAARKKAGEELKAKLAARDQEFLRRREALRLELAAKQATEQKDA